MPPYRAYLVGPDGGFHRAIDLECLDDDLAIEQAKQFVDGYDVQLWQQDRHFARLQMTSTQAKDQSG